MRLWTGQHTARSWLSLRWPREVKADQIQAALAALHGLSTGNRLTPIVLRVHGNADGLLHELGLPEPLVTLLRIT